jgi:hypothetical protein
MAGSFAARQSKTIPARSCKAHRSNYADNVHGATALVVAKMSFAIELPHSGHNL